MRDKDLFLKHIYGIGKDIHENIIIPFFDYEKPTYESDLYLVSIGTYNESDDDEKLNDNCRKVWDLIKDKYGLKKDIMPFESMLNECPVAAMALYVLEYGDSGKIDRVVDKVGCL